MVLVRAAIEADLLYSRLDCSLRNRLADDRGSIAVSTVTDLLDQFLVERAGRGNSRAAGIVNHLATEMSITAKDTQSRFLLASSNPGADMPLAPLPLLADKLLLVSHRSFHRLSVLVLCRLLDSCLTWLDLDLFTLVANSLALVWFGFPDRSHFCSKLSYLLLITSLDDDMGLIGTTDIESYRYFLLYFVCKSDSQRQGVFGDLSKVADPDNLQSFLVAFLYTGHHVLDKGPGKPVESAGFTFIVNPGNDDLLVFLVDLFLFCILDGLQLSES